MEKKLLGPQKVFFLRSCPSHIFEPLIPTGSQKKTFWGPKSFFPRSCLRHIFEPLVPRKPTKLSGAPKVFFHDPVLVTYSNPWSHESRQNMTKLSGAPKVFFHDPVSVTYLNPWSHESRQNFLGPQKFFSTILSQSHIRTPDPDRIAEKNFLGPQKFFSTILSPSHI